MPGTPEEYMQSGDFSRAKETIDQMIAQGDASGESILSSLMDSGLRVYSEGEMGEGAPEGEMPPEEGMMEEGMPEEGMPEEGAPGVGIEMGMGGPPPGEGGNRGMILEAVRFGLKKDKENKAKRQQEDEEA